MNSKPRLVSAYNDKIKAHHMIVADSVMKKYGENITFTQFIEFIVTESRTKCREPVARGSGRF